MRTDTPKTTRILGVMAKFWEPGKVKTRLGASIGMAASARLHRCFLRHLLTSLDRLDCGSELVFAPPQQIPSGQALLDEVGAKSWRIADQGGGDLGVRMSRWFSNSLKSLNDRAILIGADCPLLEPRNIGQAFAALDHHDVVLGPAVDGGYYLIGVKGIGASTSSLLETLFHDMIWSKEDVFQVTTQRLEATSWRFESLEVKEDVDTIDELQNLISSLQLDSITSEHRELARLIDRILHENRT